MSHARGRHPGSWVRSARVVVQRSAQQAAAARLFAGIPRPPFLSARAPPPPCLRPPLRPPACPSALQISSLAFSPDGTTLATADASGAMIAWDLATSRRLASTAEHRGPVWSLAYSQGEGALLASGGADNTVRVWNAKAGGAARPAARPRGGAAAQQAAQQAAQPGAAAEPYALLCTWRTKLTPVFGLRFTTRNLLLGSGALTLPPRPPPRG